jgi:hypothetical protein
MSTLRYTLFPNLAGDTKQEFEAELFDAAEIVRKNIHAKREELPLISLASYGDARSKGNSLRNNANVTYLHGLTIEHDGKDGPRVSVDDAERILKQLGVEALVYTTPSHTAQAPRWRALIPFEYDYSDAKAVHGRALALVKRAFPEGSIPTEASTLSQSWYFGRVADSPFDIRFINGTPLDLLPEFKNEPEPQVKPEPRVEQETQLEGEELEAFLTEAEALLFNEDGTARIPASLPYPEWWPVLSALTRAGERGLDLADRWCATDPEGYNRPDKQGLSGFDMVAAKFDQLAQASFNHRHGIGTLRKLAGEPPLTGGDELRALAESFAAMPERVYDRDEPEQRGPVGLIAYSADDYADLTNPITFAVAGLVPKGELTVFAGPTKVGKSLIAISLADCIVRGVPFHGHEVEKGSVLIVSKEDRAAIYRYRFAHRVHELGGDRAAARQALADRVRFVDLHGSPMLLTTMYDRQCYASELVNEVIAAAQTMPDLKLVLFETASRLHGGEENNEGFTALVSACEQVAVALDCGVILTHHYNKAATTSGDSSSSGVRGGSALVSNARSILTVVRWTDARADQMPGLSEMVPPVAPDRTLVLRLADANHSPLSEPMLFERSLTGPVAIEVEPVRVSREERERQKVERKRSQAASEVAGAVELLVAAVAEQGAQGRSYSANEWAKTHFGLAGLTARSAAQAASQAVQDGRLVEVITPRPRNPRHAVLALPPEGSE